jgi:hypothetical protein
MREVFRPDPEEPISERVFYTITSDDVRKSHIKTEVGVIDVAEVIGPVQAQDVGKRLYRLPNNAGDSYVWQCENNRQRDERLARS